MFTGCFLTIFIVCTNLFYVESESLEILTTYCSLNKTGSGLTFIYWRNNVLSAPQSYNSIGFDPEIPFSHFLKTHKVILFKMKFF